MKRNNEYQSTFIALIILTSLIALGCTLILNFTKVVISNDAYLTLSVVWVLLEIFLWISLFFQVESVYLTNEKSLLKYIVYVVFVISFSIMQRQSVLLLPMINSSIIYALSILKRRNIQSSKTIKAKITDVYKKKYVTGGINVKYYTYYSYVLSGNDGRSYQIKRQLVKHDIGKEIKGKVLNNKIYWDLNS